MALSLFTAPTEEPVSLTEAKAHLKVTGDDDDSYIGGLITAARHDIEAATHRGLVTQTWDQKLDKFPACAIELAWAPLQSVTSISYVDTEGVTQTWAASKYIVDAPSGPFAMPGRVALAYNESFPATRGIINSVTIRFVAGYGAATAVPDGLKHAMKLSIAEMYERRTPDIARKRFADVEIEFTGAGARVEQPVGLSPAVRRLIAPYTLWVIS